MPRRASFFLFSFLFENRLDFVTKILYNYKDYNGEVYPHAKGDCYEQSFQA